MIEAQVGHICRSLNYCQTYEKSFLDVREAEMLKSDSELQRRTKETSWATDCSSWYKTEDGRITNNWVGPAKQYQQMIKHFDPEAFSYH